MTKPTLYGSQRKIAAYFIDCNLREGGQAEHVANTKEELMSELEENVNLKVMNSLKKV